MKILKTLIALVITILGSYFSNKINNLLLSRLVVVCALIGIGFLISNPVLGSLLTLILLFSRVIYTQVRKDIIEDLKMYLFNKAILKSQTYLMLLFTGGIILGFVLPAVKNYKTSISIVIFVFVMLIYLVEYSNWKSFEDKINRAREISDHIESLKHAFELMIPFKEINADEIVKNRLELWKNVHQNKTNT